MPDGHVDSSAGSYAWLLDVLYGRPGHAVRPPAAASAVTWAPAGELPPGYRADRRFAVLPGGRGRAFLVSLDSRRGAGAALTAYGALRPPLRRAARLALGLVLRSGMAQPLLGRKIDVGVADAVPPRQRADVLICEHLAALLGTQRLVIAFGGGSGPYRKPVLQVFGTDAAPLAYVKVGWNDWTRAAVRAEAAALAAVPAAGRRLQAPELRHHGRWRDLELIVTAPLPAGVRRPPPELPSAEVLREICEMSPLTVSELAASPWWASLLARIAGIAGRDQAHPLVLAAGRIGGEHGHRRLQFGRWHGDLVPWNLARLGRRLYAWDWESSDPCAPVGFDAVHFGFQVAFVAERRPLAAAVTRDADAARATLTELGVPAGAHRLLSELHLLELAVRHEEARLSTGDADSRFFPAVLGLLGSPEPRGRAAAGAAAPGVVT